MKVPLCLEPDQIRYSFSHTIVIQPEKWFLCAVHLCCKTLDNASQACLLRSGPTYRSDTTGYKHFKLDQGRMDRLTCKQSFICVAEKFIERWKFTHAFQLSFSPLTKLPWVIWMPTTSTEWRLLESKEPTLSAVKSTILFSTFIHQEEIIKKSEF